MQKSIWQGIRLRVPLSGTFYRVVFAQDLPRILDGAIHPEGRFHHDGQAALYLSPSLKSVGFAIDIYVKPEDPPRVVQALALRSARMVDLRQPETCRALGLTGAESSTPWMPERAAGRPASSWAASDAARASGACGMIFAARRDPTRWHLVLFRWNQGDGAQIASDGAPISFPA
jgi:RES domain-containing protein